MRRCIYLLLIMMVAVGSFLLVSMGGKEKLDTVAIHAGDKTIQAEVADTQDSRRTGLMERKELSADHGMLFVFERDQKLSFWMKNTYIPLSIAYISADKVVMEIYDMKPQSLRPVESANYVRYALEMNQGWFDKNCIKAGDTLSW